MSSAPSRRTTVRRLPARARYERSELLAILDQGLIAHVGVSTPDGPIVLPMAYGTTERHLYLHGAAANAMLGAAVGEDICVTVSIVDGLVVARSPFHNSMNYRSVVVRGVAELVEGEQEKRAALQLISDHVVETWATGRVPSPTEIRRTVVLRVPLEEMSGKVRTGGPLDEADDLGGPYWAGHVPLRSLWGAPIPAEGLAPNCTPPPAIAGMERQSVGDAPGLGLEPRT